MSAPGPKHNVRPEVAALAVKLHDIGVAEIRAYREKHNYRNSIEQKFDRIDPWQQAAWYAIAEHVMVSQACALREQQERHAMELGALYTKGGAS